MGRHWTGLNHISLVEVRGSSQATVCPPDLISLLEFPRGRFLVLCFLLSMPLHLVAWSPDMLSLILSMLTIGSYMFPFHQASLLQRWMVYNHAWLLFSHGYRQINWNWTQIRLNSSSMGMKRQRSKYLSMFSNRAFGCWNLPSKICSPSWSDLWPKTSTSAHIYLQSVVHVFTTPGIYGIFAVTLIWIVQNCLRIL